MIYFIRSITTQHIKIGYSKKPMKRLTGLQSSNADRLELLGQLHGDPPDEADLHQRFREHRLHGEWFSCNILPQVLSILAADKSNPRPMRLNVIVSGDRDFRDDALVQRSLDELHAKDPKRPISWVLVGDLQRPVHCAAWNWAKAQRVEAYFYEPNWARYQRGAGTKVNKQLVKAQFDSKILLVFHSEKEDSLTAGLIKLATKAGIEIVRRGVITA
jgi:YspA, cpYpsA-related SLOG family/Meiotically up-regulated gene 113